MVTSEFEVVIGLETHVQLSTASKIFCGSANAFGAEPNTQIDPVTLGLPGSLPVANLKVIESAIVLGLALNCEIRRESLFARKHYFYPDLPKGYQISQFEEPICERGYLEIKCEDSVRTVGITRIHMEEDAGKSIHDRYPTNSCIDLNRAGVPLLEIVSQPDLRSPAEAAAYLKAIRQLVCWLEISDGNMEEGSLRCDANISLRPRGELAFGTRTEIKNINSFKFIEKALEYEIARQLKLIKSGEKIVQQTLLYDPDRDCTVPMRGKEESADYRYFPDPDLPPVVVEESWIRQVKDKMPLLPGEMKTSLVNDHGLTEYDAEVLTSERSYVDFFIEALHYCQNAKLVCNWITSELFGFLKRSELEFSESPVSAQALGELVALIEAETINGKIAKGILEDVARTGKSPKEIVKENGLQQITDQNQLLELVNKVLQDSTNQLEQYLAGNEKLFGYFVGQVMKLSSGGANPKLVNEILKEELDKRK